jgi:transposase-like protein
MWYPKNVLDLEDRLHTEAECRKYLYDVRWPDGFRCLRCGASSFWTKTRDRFECTRCHYEASVLSGTIFEGSNLSLRIWLRGIWLLISEKQGVSASSLQRDLGLGSYRTAWLMLHKLRKAMVKVDRNKLSGEVEFDTFYLGGKTKGYKKGAYENKLTLAIAVEVRGKGCGRMRLLALKNLVMETQLEAAETLIESKSLIITDGYTGFLHLNEKGYQHKPYPPSSRLNTEPDSDSQLPRVHRVISLIKRWHLGTLQGRMSKKHSDAYLEEFVFRFNRRTSTSRGLLFLRVLENGILLRPTTYEHLIKRN